MSGAFTQSGRFLQIRTPLGADALLLTAFRGREAVSEPFAFELELLAPASADVPFDKLLGQPAGVTLLPGDSPRFFHGVLSRMARGKRAGTLRSYRATLVPAFWLLTRRVRSRVFQQKSVPEILKEVLAGLEVKYELTGQYPQRDYCVQYQESDFAFASRLMEEEGIWYRFDHSSNSHTLVLSDNSSLAPRLADETLLFDEDSALAERVTAWETEQEVRSSGVSLWDYAFQQPGQAPDASADAPQSVQAGTVHHALRLSPPELLTRTEGPAGYAKQFDDISPNGQAQTSVFWQMYRDNTRVARLRAEEEAARGLGATGSSRTPRLTPGRRFALTGHPDADGPYFLTSVTHTAELTGAYQTGTPSGLDYSNEFTCVPLGLAFRPPRTTPRPQARGVESAVVVGPAGQAIYCDKYGRIKVRFLWDRRGTEEGVNASCWVRVAQPWAGKGWGAVTLPRVGQEVVVGFRHGDPDMPVVLGGVYNGEQMPPFPLPENASQAGFKSSSLGSDDPAEFSGLAFEDRPGHEHVHLHSQKHLTQSAEDTLFVNAGSSQHVTVGTTATRFVGGVLALNTSATVGKPAESGGDEEHGGEMEEGGEKEEGGEEKGEEKEEGEEGPFAWNPSVLGGIASDLELVVGLKNENIAGLNRALIIGQEHTSLFNPLGMLATLGSSAADELIPKFPALSGVAAGVFSTLAACKSEVKLGGVASIHYGPKVSIHRGYKVELDANKMDPIAGVWGTLFAALSTFAAFEPLLDSTLVTRIKTTVPAAVGTAAVLEAVLGVWISIEARTGLLEKIEEDRKAAREAKTVARLAKVHSATHKRHKAALKAATELGELVDEAATAARFETAELVGEAGEGIGHAAKAGGQDVYNSVQYNVYSPYTRLVSVYDPLNPPKTPGQHPFVGLHAVGGMGLTEFIPGCVVVYGDRTGVYGGTKAFLTAETDHSEEPPAGRITASATGGPVTVLQEDGPVRNTLVFGKTGVETTSTHSVSLLSPPNTQAGLPPWPQAVVELDGQAGRAVLNAPTVLIGDHPNTANDDQQVTVIVGNNHGRTVVTIHTERSSVTVGAGRVIVQAAGSSAVFGPAGIELKTPGTIKMQCSAMEVSAG